MELESVGLGGAAAFREVRVQSIVVEFLLTHVDVLFSDTFTSAGLDPAGMPTPPADTWLEPLLIRAALGGQVGSRPPSRPPRTLDSLPAPCGARPGVSLPAAPLLLISAPRDPHFSARPDNRSSFTPL